LSEYLYKEGYNVIGVKRRSSTDTTERLRPFIAGKTGDRTFNLFEGDITDYASMSGVFQQATDAFKGAPHEVYNLAAQSHVGTSFSQPLATWDSTANGVLNVLEVMRQGGYIETTRFYQASTSEMFGDNYVAVPRDGPGLLIQDESVSFNPRSPYAVAKVAAHNAVNLYRDAYGLFGCCGILFNHESPRRGENFVTRKITKWVAGFYQWCQKYNVVPSSLVISEHEVYIPGRVDISQGFQYPKLKLGNLSASRDWGHAQDYVRSMHMMLQQQKPDDYVIATGEAHSVAEFCEAAFKYIGITDWQKFVEIDSAFIRPAEVPHLQGVATKAHNVLGWSPQVTFTELVEDMMRNDLEIARNKE
jgi:GDPmannose 4,6-dehydratase